MLADSGSGGVSWYRQAPRNQIGLVRLPGAKGMPFMFKSTSTSLILLGILAVIVGVIAIAWPGVTILALAILFAIYAFVNAGLHAASAFTVRTPSPLFAPLLLPLLDLAPARS